MFRRTLDLEQEFFGAQNIDPTMPRRFYLFSFSFAFAVSGFCVSRFSLQHRPSSSLIGHSWSSFGTSRICLERPKFLWASLCFPPTPHPVSVVLMRTESLSAPFHKRIHYCDKSILSQFPSGLLHPVNSLHFHSPVLEACDGVITFLVQGRNGWLSGSVLRPNGLLFNTVLSSSSLSNHRLKKYNLHYIHLGSQLQNKSMPPL